MYLCLKCGAQGEVQDELITIQPQFKDTLVTNVEVFQQDTTQFYADYGTVCCTCNQHALVTWMSHVLQFRMRAIRNFKHCYSYVNRLSSYEARLRYTHVRMHMCTCSKDQWYKVSHHEKPAIDSTCTRHDSKISGGGSRYTSTERSSSDCP